MRRRCLYQLLREQPAAATEVDAEWMYTLHDVDSNDDLVNKAVCAYANGNLADACALLAEASATFAI